MPTVSIDTFFACSLIVSVALIATAFATGTIQTQIDSMQGLNKENYLRTIADHIVSSYGNPSDWGSTGSAPTDFGLAASNSALSYELDIDKISRLNSQNEHSLSYPEIFDAARLNNIAFGLTVTQMLSTNVALSANVTSGSSRNYTFTITVDQDSVPVMANLHCYFVASNFLSYVSNTTSSSGVGLVSVQIPNSSNGTALLAVFARAQFDDKLTSFEMYSFAHLSQEPLPNGTFLELSPLNYTLTFGLNFPGTTTISEKYAFSYAYQSNLTSTSNSTYAIPLLLDKSPIVLVFQGVNGTRPFVEWTSYPQVPLEFGANFANSEENVFVYPVAVKGTLYKLALRFGDVIR